MSTPSFTRILLVLVAAVSCSERDQQAKDEEALEICTTYCQKFLDCGVEPEASPVEECAEMCADYDWAWRDGCREEIKAQYACVNSLSCEDFAITQDFEADAELKSCRDEQHEASICVSEHGGIDD